MVNMRWAILGVLTLAATLLMVGPQSSTAQAQVKKVPVLIAFDHQPGPNDQALVRRAGGDIKYTYTIVNAIAASMPQAAVDALSRNPNVLRVENDIQVHAVGQVTPWGVDRLDADVVGSTGETGVGVKVGVLDSGIDLKHPDLNVAGNVTFAGGKDGSDKYGHGTHVAGTIAGLDNGIGVLGVAPGVELYAIKVLGNSGSGSYSNVIAGLEYAIANGMDVTNNSYGSSGDPGQTVHNAFIAANNAGILNIAAAGNSSGAVIYPAAWPEVVAVSATNSSDALASFSSFGLEIELAAPGRDIYSTYKGSYATLSGTSMAAPHVVGVAALVIGAKTASGPDDVRARLHATAVDLGAGGFDHEFGYGLVDAENAVLGIADGDDPVVNGGGTTDPPPDDESGDPPPSDSSAWGSAAIDWSMKVKGRGGSMMDLSQTITARDSGGNNVADAVVAVRLTYAGPDGDLTTGGDNTVYTASAATGSDGKVTVQLKFASQGNYMLAVTGGADHDAALDLENPSCFDTVNSTEFACP